MHRIKRFALATVAIALGGCASITKGTEQKVTVNTVPQGASCTLKRQDGVIAMIPKTPQSVTLSKSWNDVHIGCAKPGYRKTEGILNAQTEVMTFGNVLIGGLVGVAIDAGTGAMNKYDGAITIPLVPQGQRAPREHQPRRRPEKPVS